MTQEKQKLYQTGFLRMLGESQAVIKTIDSPIHAIIWKVIKNQTKTGLDTWSSTGKRELRIITRGKVWYDSTSDSHGEFASLQGEARENQLQGGKEKKAWSSHGSVRAGTSSSKGL